MNDQNVKRDRVEYAPRNVSHAATVADIEADRVKRMNSKVLVFVGHEKNEDIHKAS